jgi:hypothetical protein
MASQGKHDLGAGMIGGGAVGRENPADSMRGDEDEFAGSQDR